MYGYPVPEAVEDIVMLRFRYWSNWGCYDPESIEEG